ncbi:MAG: DUF6252 family protein [Bergeyella sp.]
MRTKFYFFALLSLCLFSCRDKDQDPNVLPEATQHGANTGGALVDGKVWVASTKYLNTLGGAGTYCEKIDNTTLIQIDLRHVSDNSRILIKAAIDNFELNKTYILSQNDSLDYNFARYIDNNSKWYLTQPNSTYIGKLKITKLNLLQDQMVCGTFEFKAVDKDGNTVNITDGRFDKKFD